MWRCGERWQRTGGNPISFRLLWPLSHSRSSPTSSSLSPATHPHSPSSSIITPLPARLPEGSPKLDTVQTVLDGWGPPLSIQLSFPLTHSGENLLPSLFTATSFPCSEGRGFVCHLRKSLTSSQMSATPSRIPPHSSPGCSTAVLTQESVCPKTTGLVGPASRRAASSAKTLLCSSVA